MKKFNFSLTLFFYLTGCSLQNPEGLSLSERTGGPVVVFDLSAKPLPEIPFPNDIACVPDDSTLTGLRINVSQEAPTNLERDVRKKINTLDGFSIYGPITVSFTSRLDIENILNRHGREEIPDFSNDAVYLFNIDPSSSGFGEAVLLDLGSGHFPVVLEKTDNYFPNDPLRNASNLLFAPGNVFPEGGDEYLNLIDFYEFETNTLIIRPVIPLREKTKYAVVLTKRLVGVNGKPVQSPFPYINHTQQTENLKPLLKILPEYSLTLNDIAFVWSFTTQSATDWLVNVRKGLYGSGPFKWLKEKYPPEIEVQKISGDTENPYILKMDEKIEGFIKELAQFWISSMPQEQLDKFIKLLRFIDYFVGFKFKTPYFLADKDGISSPGYPADDDEIFQGDLKKGRAFVGEDTVTVICAIPKRTEKYSPPFPVNFYGHGYTSFRLEMLGFAGSLARFGIATCGMDAVGHGMDLNKSEKTIAELLAKNFGMENLYYALLEGRSRDLNNDGESDSGGDFWTADTFHTRDIVRQTIIDYFQLIRIMRSWDGKNRWSFDLNGDGNGEIAGDFNADGIVDAGGPLKSYYAWGQSLGGILSAILAGLEPAVRASAPTAGGAGLSDIGIRSTQGGVVEAVFLRIMGPLIIGYPEEASTVFEFYVPDVNRKGILRFYYAEGINPGDRVVVENLVNGEMDEDIVKGDGTFRLQIPADAVNAVERRKILNLKNEPGEVPEPVAPLDNTVLGDKLRITIIDGKSGEKKMVIDRFGIDVKFQGTLYLKGSTLVAPAEGFGLKRNTPDMRRFMTIAQMILDPGDPVAYAPHYFKEPFDFSDVDPQLPRGTNVLVIPTAGDMNVPVNTGVAIARAAGIIELFKPHLCFGKPADRLFIEFHVLEGIEKISPYIDPYHQVRVLFDIDDLDYSKYFFNYDKSLTFYVPSPNDFYPGCEPLRLKVKTPYGVSGLRIPYIYEDGEHGFFIPSPQKSHYGFDIDTYMINLIGRYFETDGKEILDDPCLEDDSCDFIQPFSP